MKSSKKAVSLISCLAWLSLSFAPGEAADGKVAVHLVNLASERHESLVRELSDVLVTSLTQGNRLKIVESAQTEETIETLGLGEPISTEEAAKLGEALDVDAVVVGSFADVYQIDAELIDVTSQELLAEQSASGKRSEVFDMVDQLGEGLLRNFSSLDKAECAVAVLYFENLASDEYRLFVRGISDMMMTSLRQSEGLRVIERGKIGKGMEDCCYGQDLGLEPGKQINSEQASALGSWLGADVVVMGRFTEIYQIDASSVDVKRGEMLVEKSIKGKRSEIVDLVSELGGKLLGSLSKFYKKTRKIAVLYFENHTSEEYDRFVRGISDMLMTSLGQSDKLTIIERVQIEKAMENFSLELSGPIDAEAAVEVGKWLGADGVVLGSFNAFGEEYRLDARLIDAETGELLIAQNVRGSEADVMAMVDQLGAKMIDSFGEKQTEIKGGTGFLRIQFMVTRAEMTEKPVYLQICKLFVDGKEMGISPVVQKAEEWISLFSEELGAGSHDVEVMHGFVKDGKWDGEFSKQPRVFRVTIEPGETTTIQYSFGVGWFTDDYYYEPPWRGGS